MSEISFSYETRRTRVAWLLDKKDESKSYKVQVLLYDDTKALVIYYHDILLCDIVIINGEQFLRRIKEVFESDDYIQL